MAILHKKGLNCSILTFVFSALWVLAGLWVASVFIARSNISRWLVQDIKTLVSETESTRNFYEYFASRPYIVKLVRLSPGSGVKERPLVKKGARSVPDFFSGEVKIGKENYRLWYTPEFFISYAKEKITVFIIFEILWLIVGALILHIINSRILFEPLSRLSEGTMSPGELAEIKSKKCSPFADVAMALEYARSQMSLYARHSALLLQAAKSISSQIELNHAVSMILDLVVEKFPGTSACVVLIDDDGYMRIKNSRGLSADFIKKIRLRRGEGFVGECIESRKIIIVQDALTDKNPATADILESENIKSFIHIPIMIENRAAGAFNINSPQKNYFTQEIIGVAATLAEYLSIAISNARLYDRLRDFNRRLETEVSYTTSELLKTNAKLVRKIRMLRVAMDIFSTLESADGSPSGEAEGTSQDSGSETITRIFSRIRDVLNVDFGALLISNSITSKDEEITFRLVHRFSGFKEPENNFPPSDSKYSPDKLSTIFSSVLVDGKPYLSNSASQGGYVRPGFVPKEIFIKNYLIVPVISHRRPLALVFFGNKMGGDGFDDEDVEFMSLVSPRIGFYIYCREFCRHI